MIGGELILRESLEKIFKEYPTEKNKNFINNPLVNFIEVDFPNDLQNLIGEYKILGSAGKGSFTKCPRISILDPEITEFVGSGYFVMYIFSEDTKRLYLSLNQSIPKLDESISQKKHIQNLKNNALIYQGKLGKLPDGFETKELDLGVPSYFRKHQVANICAKEYNLENLPSEEVLEADLRTTLKLYSKLKYLNSGNSGIRDFIKSMLENYQDAKTDEKLAKKLIDNYANKQEFQKYLMDIANQSGNGDYDTYGYFGAADSLIFIPRVSICDKNSSSSFYIYFRFREDMRGVYLTLACTYRNADKLMKKTGETFKKFDETHQNYIKASASDARNKLIDLTSIPDNFVETIDLNSQRAESAPAIEASNIYAKYYTLDNLPTEDELVSDFKEILDLYEKLEDLQNTKTEIRDFIKKMLENYLKAKTNEKLAKELVPFANGNHFHKYLIDLANEFKSGDYGTFGLFGAANKLSRIPYLQIHNKKYSTWCIIFLFREDMSGVYLSLGQQPWTMDDKLKKKGLNIQKFSEEFNNYLLKDAIEARNKLKRITSIPNDYLEKIDLGSKKAISAASREAGAVIAKYYTLNNLPSEDQLISDLKEIFSFYDILAEIEKGELVLENSIIDLEIISKSDEIDFLEEKLFEGFKKISDKKVQGIIGFPGGNDEGDLYWSNNLKIWFFSKKYDNLYWNAFGTQEPIENGNNSITTEINLIRSGFNKRRAGAFAKDNEGEYYLVHSGKIGGGKKGVGKNLFFENYNGDVVKARYGDSEGEVAVIGNLNDSNFYNNLKNFVYYVNKLKNGGENLNDPNFFDYLTENGYLFDQKLVENFLLSLKVKPFVILTGNSGTGKTKVAQLFAEYLNQQETVNPPGESADIISKEVDITTKSKNLRGNWELNADELEKLQDFQENLTLEVHRGRSNTKKTGKGHIKNKKLYYNDNTPFFDEISKIMVGSRAKIQVIAKEYQESPSKTKHEIVPVGANWTENRHVVGFYNVITGNYQKTQALDLILKANKENNVFEKLSDPYFLILDEMNLSHVERYFSDFLSVMESQEKMPLHDNRSEEVPKKLELPANLQVIGTVNVDETTYMFSPKVLDRANTIEFLTLSPLEYMKQKSNSSKPSGNVEYLENTLSDLETRNYTIDKLQEEMKNIKTTNNQVLWDVISIEIDTIYTELKKAGFDFGFRVVNEIMRFMYVSWKYEGNPEKWENWERYFDAQIKQKMLPKLHGSQRTLQNPIKSLFEICYGKTTDDGPRLITPEELKSAKYPTAALKLSEMDKVLYEQRYVAFIN